LNKAINQFIIIFLSIGKSSGFLIFIFAQGRHTVYRKRKANQASAKQSVKEKN